MERNPVLSVRIPKAMIEMIDRAVEAGEYRNRGDYVAAALRHYSMYCEAEKAKTGGGVAPVPMPPEENDRGESMEWQTRRDLVVLIVVGIVVFGILAYTVYRENLNVKDYDLDLIYTDGLQTRFTIEFDADRPGVMTAELDGVGIPLNLDGEYSIEFERGHNSIKCTVAGVGQSGTHLLNSIDFHFT